jgi:signal transduction histidine kinase
MKLRLILFFFILSLTIAAQKSKLESSVVDLKTKIKKSQGGDRLRWLDSLAVLTGNKKELGYDSIVNATIIYALQIDSLTIATKNTANLIFYKNNIINTPDDGLKQFKNFSEIIKRVKNYKVLTQFYLNGADSFYFLGEYKLALKNYEVAKTYALKSGDIRALGLVNLYMGYTNSDVGAFSKASIQLRGAARLFIKVKDTYNTISAKNSLSILYSRNAFYAEAEKERQEAIYLAKKIDDHRSLVSLYFNAAEDYRKMGNAKKAIENFLLALNLNARSEQSRFLRPKLLCKLVVAYVEDDNIRMTSKYLLEIKRNPKIYGSGNNKEYYIQASQYIAYAKGDFSKALTLGIQHLKLKKEVGHYEDILYSEKFLAKVYNALGDKTNSYYHLNNYYAIKDSISSVQNVKALSYYQTLYEIEKRDLKIETQNSDIEVLSAVNKMQNQWGVFGASGLVSLFVFVVLIRSRNTARRERKTQEKFSKNLIEAQEEERIWVARELHDGVGQKLMLLTKKLKIVRDSELISLSEKALDEIRSISRGLHPPMIEGLGVTTAIESMINEVDSHTGIFFTNEIDIIDNFLSKEAALQLYRIIQEILNNIVKHAHAKAVFINIEKSEKYIEVTIEDNGDGADFSKEYKTNTSLGMKTLRERSKIIRSELKIVAQLNKGTTIHIKIPL